MRILHIPTRHRISLTSSFIKEIAKKLPKKVGLITTVQFSDTIKKISLALKKEGKQILISGNGIILGCKLGAATKIQDKVHAFLYIGSGNFHPLSLASTLKKQKPIFLFNPVTEQFYKFNYKAVEKLKAKQKAAIIKILGSDKIGIFVSVKPGQCRLDKALKIKEKLENQGKQVYAFLADTLDIAQFENWPGLAWLNTACPTLPFEYPLLDSRIYRTLQKH